LYPYNHAPLFKDLLAVIANYKSIEGFSSSCTTLLAPHTNEIRFGTLHHLVAIMPIQSYTYIPEDLYRFYTLDAGLLHSMPSAGITIDSEFTEKEYQQRAILPLPNYTEIMTCLHYAKLKKTLLQKHSVRDEYSYLLPAMYSDELAPYIVPKKKYVASTDRGRGTSFRGKEESTTSSRGRGRGRGTTTTSSRGRGTGARGRGTTTSSRGKEESTKPRRMAY